MAKIKIKWLDQSAPAGATFGHKAAVIGRVPVAKVTRSVLTHKFMFEIALPMQKIGEQIGEREKEKEAMQHVESQVQAWFERCGL